MLSYTKTLLTSLNFNVYLIMPHYRTPWNENIRLPLLNLVLLGKMVKKNEDLKKPQEVSVDETDNSYFTQN